MELAIRVPPELQPGEQESAIHGGPAHLEGKPTQEHEEKVKLPKAEVCESKRPKGTVLASRSFAKAIKVNNKQNVKEQR